MPPQFRFQTILDLRKRTEDERQMALARALQAAASVRIQQERVGKERLRAAEKLKGLLNGFVDPSIVEQRYRYLTGLDQQLQHLGEDLRRADEAVLAERHRLADAMKERKTLEKLKEYDHRDFLAAHLQKEQEALDDLNVARYFRQS